MVGRRNFNKIGASLSCGTGHGVCLSGAGLSVGEDGDDALLVKFRQQVLNLILIARMRFLMLAICVVELEFEILHVFCDPVYLDLGLVHDYLRIQHADCVDLALLDLLGKQWPLPDTYA